MNGNDQARLAADHAEIVLHDQVKVIVVAEGIEYADALERVWYEPDNAELVEAYRGFSCDGEAPEGDEPLSPFDAGLEAGKRARAYMADHETDQETALNAVLAADVALSVAWDANLVVGTN